MDGVRLMCFFFPRASRLRSSVASPVEQSASRQRVLGPIGSAPVGCDNDCQRLLRGHCRRP
jgi:hypothetical protein